MSKTLEELFKDVIVEPQKEYDWGEKEYIARLEKAFTLACEYLEYSEQFNGWNYDEDKSSWSKEQWKEYLLNED